MVELVGILNVTPDSFSDGGAYFSPEDAIMHGKELFADGAALVDVGAESTRPGAIPLSPDEEWRRLEPVLRTLIPAFPGQISLDSYHPETVRRAWAIGPVVINDVTGMNNPAMVDAVAGLRPTVIISHLPGTDIQAAHRDMPVRDVKTVKNELLGRAARLMQRGLRREQIILDPGIGFGKQPEVNPQLLRFAELVPDFAVMIGYSRKRFLGEQRKDLEPNLAAGQIAITHGARYLRVHDVKGHQSIIKKTV